MEPKINRRFIVAITGASGTEYALRFLWHLAALEGESDIIFSPNFFKVLAEETTLSLDTQEIKTPNSIWEKIWELIEERYGKRKPVHNFSSIPHNDIGARAASGSAHYAAMVVLPCSMKTLAAIAHGLSQNLIERAADVSLKEKRPLILCPRETPLSTIHLQNMFSLSQMGATIMPLMPGYYHKPQTLNALYDFMADRILQHLSLGVRTITPWKEDI
ncbi:MAG: Flavin prenyltransferase UbiX [Turneriella sp.]|nr:Flavin prenyltransferase UbiX [Turneriella sp.]